MINKLKTISAVTRYLVKGVSPLTYKISHLPRFIDLYTLHTRDKQQQIAKQLAQFNDEHRVSPYQRLRMQVFSLPKKVLQRSQLLKQRARSFHKTANYEQQSRNFFKKFFQYMSLYYQSLQSLVEGKRQVLHNPDYKFQDGMTAQEKTQKFEESLSKMLGKTKTRNKQ